jgi:hypothetical protein
MSITITGASDDLIEVDGDISEEFNPSDGEDSLLGFSNGVLLRVRYDEDGIWRITPLAGQVKMTHGSAVEDTNDVATLLTPADWVVCGTAWAGKTK